MAHRATLRMLALVCLFAAAAAAGCVRTRTVIVRTDVSPRMKAFPSTPKFEALSQTTAVDIEATSRFRSAYGGPDTANVTTTIVLPESPSASLRRFLRSQDRVRVSFAEDRVVRLFYRANVALTSHQENKDRETYTDTYTYQLDSPLPFLTIRKNGDVSGSVLLPRPASKFTNPPGYDVTLREASAPDERQIVAPTKEEQRTTVLWYAKVDQPWSVVYQITGKIP